MVRAILAAALSVAVAGCYRGATLEPDRAVRLWRAEARPASGSSGGPAGVEALVARAVRESPELRALRAEAAVARAAIGEADQLENPQLRLTQFRFDEALASDPEVEVALRVPIPRPGELAARRHAAGLRAAALEAEVRDAERQVAASVRRVWARLLVVERELALAERAVAIRERHRELVAAQAQAGQATKVDRSLVELPYAEALADRDEILARRELLRIELERRIGAPPGEAIDLRVAATRIGVRVPATGLEALTEWALERRADVRRAGARVIEAQAVGHLERAEAWPWLRWAEVGYTFERDLAPAAWGLGVSLELPIFSWNQGGVAVADAQVERRRAEERARIAAVAAEVRAALARVKSTARRLEAMRGSWLAAGEASAAAVADAEAARTSEPLARTVVEERRLKAERAFLDVLEEHLLAWEALRSAVGGELPAE